MIALVQVFLLDIDAQGHLAPGTGGEDVLNMRQVACYQGKQIGGLGVRVMPGCAMAAAVQTHLLKKISVTQQYRVAGLIGINGDGKYRHHIRTIQVIGDFAKTVSFTLGAEHFT